MFCLYAQVLFGTKHSKLVFSVVKPKEEKERREKSDEEKNVITIIKWLFKYV